MQDQHKINYLEIPALDMQATKDFFSAVFDWGFTDYGPEYSSFDNAGIDGGFYLADKVASVASGSVLIVLYSEDLTSSAKKVLAHGGSIIRETFSFPGGSRFHFSDPNGNEFAVWKKD
ncbi:glyoxalase ['Osedax' symbiont bacterium Rs2_46_30_T18]|nr:glyoxalase ['Osedax' symbiont bacterium Rs2_46_30_T18]